MANFPCVHTIELNKYLAQQEREDLEAERRWEIEGELEEQAGKQMTEYLQVNEMDAVKELCEEYGQDFDIICSLLMKNEAELFVNVFVLHSCTDGDIETLSKMAVGYFDYESKIDEAIENEKELNDE